MSTQTGRDIIFVVSFILFSVAVGMVIYKAFVGATWLDSFYNSSMILSGAGPIIPLTTGIAKVLVSIFALYGGIYFLLVAALIITRIYNVDLGELVNS